MSPQHFLLLPAALFAAVLPVPALRAAAPETFVDPDTRLVFPPSLGTWQQVRITEYDEPGLGRSIGYNAAGLGAITCYIYDGGIADIPTGGDGDVLLRAMRQSLREIPAAWQRQGAEVREHLPVCRLVAPGDDTAAALLAVHLIEAPQTTASSVTLFAGFRGRFLKLRYTRPGSDVDVTLRIVGEFLAALREVNRTELPPPFLGEHYTQAALTPPAPGDAPQLGIAVQYDPAKPNDAVGAIWLSYCLALAQSISEHAPDYLDVPLDDELVPTFAAECHARTTALEVYRDMLADKTVRRDRYWEDIQRVEAAGFLPEYVWTHHRRPAWREDEAPPRLAEFATWATRNLKRHQPFTNGRLTRSSGD